jgi:Pyruvate/2-oxoacid:ferredoxin oxidoreductase gamma subunit
LKLKEYVEQQGLDFNQIKKILKEDFGISVRANSKLTEDLKQMIDLVAAALTKQEEKTEEKQEMEQQNQEVAQEQTKEAKKEEENQEQPQELTEEEKRRKEIMEL